jgi:hypothetical protein
MLIKFTVSFSTLIITTEYPGGQSSPGGCFTKFFIYYLDLWRVTCSGESRAMILANEHLTNFSLLLKRWQWSLTCHRRLAIPFLVILPKFGSQGTWWNTILFTLPVQRCGSRFTRHLHIFLLEYQSEDHVERHLLICTNEVLYSIDHIVRDCYLPLPTGVRLYHWTTLNSARYFDFLLIIIYLWNVSIFFPFLVFLFISAFSVFHG